MEEVKNIIGTVYAKIKEIEETHPQLGIELSEYLNELYQNLSTERNDLYKVSEKQWLDVLYPAIDGLNDLSDEDIYISVKKSFKNYGEIYLLNDINQSNFPLEFGNKMESLYYGKDTIVGIHGTTMSEEDIENKIFEEGLACNYGPRIDCTVNLQDEDNLSFNRFMKYVYKLNSKEQAIIVCIPKEMACSPMWKKEGETHFLTPSYIYGYYTPHIKAEFNPEPKIIHNKNYGLETREAYDLCDKTLLEQYKEDEIVL